MKNVSHAEFISVAAIQVPEKYRRRGDVVEDDKLRQSIECTGVQQPLVVCEIALGQYVLVDGYRRLEVAKYLKMSRVPCVVDEAPSGTPIEEYRDRIRFILDEHRQDLFPSQRAALLKTLMKNFSMNKKQVGEYLGVDATTIGNWLVVDSFIPEVSKAIDAGVITQHAARVFVGMTPTGQAEVWKSRKDELRTVAPAKLHRMIRQEFHPAEHPEFYQKPERVLRKLNRGHKKRVAARRPIITKSEREMLSKDIELREAELRDAERDLAQYKREIELATGVIRAILQNKSLYKLVPPDIKDEFARFAEIYV